MITDVPSPYCFVPGCSNTIFGTPEKIFFDVPTGYVRNTWCELVKREPLSPTTIGWCCQDHFTLETDVEDWTAYKTMMKNGLKEFKPKLKHDVVPHVFNSQPDTTRQQPEINTNLNDSTKAGASASLACKIVNNTDMRSPESRTGEIVEHARKEPCANFNGHAVQQKKPSNNLANSSTQTDETCDVSQSIPEFGHVNSSYQASFHCPLCSNGLQGVPIVKHTEIQTEKICQCFKRSQNDKVNEDATELNVIHSSDVLNSNSCVNDADYSDEDESYEKEGAKGYRNSLHLQSCLLMIQGDPKLFIGIDPVCTFIITALEKFSKLPRIHIFIALRKLRENDSNEKMAWHFSRSASSISKIIHKSFPVIATFLKTLIIWAERDTIQSTIPLSFSRAGYSKTESILGSFEIQIEEPSDPTHQFLTRSVQRECNTAKYLVSCTPDGCVNFVSKGFGGRTSDIEMVRKSEYLNKLKENTYVMVNQGFKRLEAELAKKKCILVRPRKVTTNCDETREDASIFRVPDTAIRRIREYKFLGTHTCLNHDLLGLVDPAVLMACALSNMQSPLNL